MSTSPDTFFTRSGSSPPSMPTDLRLLERVPRSSIPDALAEIERVRSRLLLRLHTPEEAPREEIVLLTADEVAERLNVSRRFVYDHAAKLGRVQISARKVRFRADAVEEYMRRRA